MPETAQTAKRVPKKKQEANRVFEKRSFSKTRDFSGSMPEKLPESAQTAEFVQREKPALRAGEATLNKLGNSSVFGRGFTRAFSAVRCRRKGLGFAETRVPRT